ncbi:MAG: gliding motility lipoprotein GldH [Bacteroidetes bacterium]|nr:gliding motility lipoprotein GldH [Bacteroidota bacterium]
MIKYNLELIVFIVLSLTLASCDPTRFYEENKKIPKAEWDQNSPLLFQTIIADTTIPYNVYINVRNAGNYRFSNLYLFINTVFPGGQIQRDTLECTLAAPDGLWLGEGLGDIFSNKILFKENVKFPQSGEYRFELFQAMRINPLPGIFDAGIRIEKSK